MRTAWAPELNPKSIEVWPSTPVNAGVTNPLTFSGLPSTIDASDTG